MTGALREERPDLVVVVGDVNATLAATLAAQEHRIPVAHVEAGLRSFDRSMPEEVNRVVVDHLADLLFTPSRDADENLLREGVAPERIHLVGNIMIDTLVAQLDAARRLDQAKRLGLAAGGYALVTLHRPANVDAEEPLRALVRVLAWVQERIPIVFPVHPRTRARLEGSGGLAELAALRGVRLLRPLAYREFLSLQATARFVMTDSGGVQEETTFLGVPCLTVRRTTERPITVEEGTNEVVGTDSVRIQSAVEAILEGRWKSGHPPELWDGKTAGRVADVLLGRARPPGGQARG
jgi:UDP-N-acetylglucosamine 2-epimerase (non-hydrolysing)